jgi:hypothetical protein
MQQQNVVMERVVKVGGSVCGKRENGKWGALKKNGVAGDGVMWWLVVVVDEWDGDLWWWGRIVRCGVRRSVGKVFSVQRGRVVGYGKIMNVGK